MARRKDPLIPDALLDQLLSGSEAVVSVNVVENWV